MVPEVDTCNKAEVKLFCIGRSQEILPTTWDTTKFHIMPLLYQTSVWNQAHSPNSETCQQLPEHSWRPEISPSVCIYLYVHTLKALCNKPWQQIWSSHAIWFLPTFKSHLVYPWAWRSISGTWFLPVITEYFRYLILQCQKGNRDQCSLLPQHLTRIHAPSNKCFRSCNAHIVRILISASMLMGSLLCLDQAHKDQTL